MAERSAGVLLYRHGAAGLEVLLAHFGGPYWARKDAGAWGIPKGMIEPGENEEEAARREYREELGAEAPAVLFPLTSVRQKSGKVVTAFASEGDFDPESLVSNEVRLEWPPRSGEFRLYPELDRAGWFGMDAAREKMLPGQLPLLDALVRLLGRNAS